MEGQAVGALPWILCVRGGKGGGYELKHIRRLSVFHSCSAANILKGVSQTVTIRYQRSPLDIPNISETIQGTFEMKHQSGWLLVLIYFSLDIETLMRC